MGNVAGGYGHASVSGGGRPHGSRRRVVLATQMAKRAGEKGVPILKSRRKPKTTLLHVQKGGEKAFSHHFGGGSSHSQKHRFTDFQPHFPTCFLQGTGFHPPKAGPLDGRAPERARRCAQVGSLCRLSISRSPFSPIKTVFYSGKMSKRQFASSYFYCQKMNN